MQVGVRTVRAPHATRGAVQLLHACGCASPPGGNRPAVAACLCTSARQRAAGHKENMLQPNATAYSLQGGHRHCMLQPSATAGRSAAAGRQVQVPDTHYHGHDTHYPLPITMAMIPNRQLVP